MTIMKPSCIPCLKIRIIVASLQALVVVYVYTTVILLRKHLGMI
ncbi:hypothetical protein OROMI_027097 [Orobanche minor]